MIIHRPELLAKILGYSLKEIDEIINDIKLHPRKYYFSYVSKTVKNGKIKERPIDPSRDKLRDIQNKIQKKLLSKFSLPDHIQGSRRGRSNITNAQQHRSKKIQFQTDLTKFFQFVTNRMVFNMFRENGFSPDVSKLLTQLTTFKGHLPQGAPTSPLLANLVGLNFDNPILQICKENNITYTRYVDDLWFSSQSDIQHLIPSLLEILQANGFLYSYAKTFYKKGKIEGTGCLVKTNGLLTTTKKQEKKLADPTLSASSRKGLEYYKAKVESS